MSDSLGQDDAGLAHLDCYLDQVRRYLRPLPAAEAEEAVQELRFHVLDKVEGAPTPLQSRLPRPPGRRSSRAPSCSGVTPCARSAVC